MESDFVKEQREIDSRQRRQRKELLVWARKRYPGLKWKGRAGEATVRGTKSSGSNRITTLDVNVNHADDYYAVRLWEGIANQVRGEGDTKDAAFRDLEKGLRHSRHRARQALYEAERALAALKSARKPEAG